MEVCESERWKLESPLKCKVRSRMFQMIHQNFAVKKTIILCSLLYFSFLLFDITIVFPINARELRHTRSVITLLARCGNVQVDKKKYDSMHAFNSNVACRQ